MHPDLDELAMVALDEAEDETQHHVAGCETCRAQVREFALVVEAGRIGPLQQPPERVWEAIEAATASSELPEPTPLRPSKRRGRSTTRLLAVAAASAIVGAGAVLAVQQLAQPQEQELAAADLAPLGAWSAAGTAVVREEEGQLVLVVDLPTEPVQGFREVWLISDDLSGLVSLGVLTGAEGTFPLPEDLDLEEFSLVDVSAEPMDGDPAHSGDSVARGELRA